MDKKFNKKIVHWNEINDPEAASNFYWQAIFPEILMRAKKRSTKYLKKYDCLISLVGLSPEPVILTIKILEPEFVPGKVGEHTTLSMISLWQYTAIHPVVRSEIGVEDVHWVLRDSN